MKYRGIVGLAFITAVLASPYVRSEPKKDTSELSDMALPEFTSEGHLVLPTGYRMWIFVGSSIGLSYFGKEAPEGPGVFHHIYIQPEAYLHYIETGKFADKTMLVMENYSTGKKEKNTAGALMAGKEFDILHGHFEDKRLGLEVALKDEGRFEEGWAYFNFSSPRGLKKTSASFPKAVCWSCHNAHGADDNVFVQFYPVLREPLEKRLESQKTD